MQRLLEASRNHQVAGDQASSELRRREADCREALAAKDAQIAVLRTRLEEADLELDARRRQLNELQATDDRCVLRFLNCFWSLPLFPTFISCKYFSLPLMSKYFKTRLHDVFINNVVTNGGFLV